MRAFRVTVTATPTLILAGQGSRCTSAFIRNASTGLLFLGDADVTPATGFEVQGNTTFGPVRIWGGHSLWGVRASGTSVVHVLIQGG